MNYYEANAKLTGRNSERRKDAQYFGSAVVVEHRFVENIIQGIQQDGLTIE